LFKKHYSKRVL